MFKSIIQTLVKEELLAIDAYSKLAKLTKNANLAKDLINIALEEVEHVEELTQLAEELGIEGISTDFNFDFKLQVSVVEDAILLEHEAIKSYQEKLAIVSSSDLEHKDKVVHLLEHILEEELEHQCIFNQYKSMAYSNFKDFYNSIIKPRRELLQLNEGGAAGHMMHVIDDRDMTFVELEQMISKLFHGEIDITEKVDGQNISVTWKDGQIGLARNKSTILNPLSIKETAEKFSGRGEIQTAFVTSLTALDKALKKVPENVLEDWFQNGKRFISAEIIYQPTKNVIDYDNRSMIIIHNLTEYDEKGNKVDEDTAVAKDIHDVLSKHGATNQDAFEITGPQKLNITNSVKAADRLNVFKKNLYKLVKASGLSINDTIGDYCDSAWKQYLVKQFPGYPDNVIDALVNVLSKGDRSTNLRMIKQMVSDAGLPVAEFTSKYNKVNSKSGLIYKRLVEPLEMLIIDAGADFLQMLNGFVSANPDKSIKALAKEVNAAIENMDGVDDEALAYQIEKLNKIGLDRLVPAEGIVFKHNNKVYKLTGSFAPINMILGYFRYKR